MGRETCSAAPAERPLSVQLKDLCRDKRLRRDAPIQDLPASANFHSWHDPVGAAVTVRRRDGCSCAAISACAQCRQNQTRTGGRPPKLTNDDIEAAKALLANSDIGVTQIAHRLGVSPATLYRYIPAARTANTPGV